jgi:hypothetical protein
MFFAHQLQGGVKTYNTVDFELSPYEIISARPSSRLAGIGGTIVPDLSSPSETLANWNCRKDCTFRAKITLSKTEASNSDMAAVKAKRPGRLTSIPLIDSCAVLFIAPDASMRLDSSAQSATTDQESGYGVPRTLNAALAARCAQGYLPLAQEGP